jgi:hypothetical protein
MDEAELILGLSATLGSYLSKKGDREKASENDDITRSSFSEVPF